MAWRKVSRHRPDPQPSPRWGARWAASAWPFATATLVDGELDPFRELRGEVNFAKESFPGDWLVGRRTESVDLDTTRVTFSARSS